MNSPLIQLLVLAGIAIFLIMKLRGVLGTREGFERPVEPPANSGQTRNAPLEVVQTGEDRDITDHVPADSPSAEALAAMKRIEPDFNVGDFLNGARGAYEMILMGFERGEMDDLVPFLSRDVFESFDEVVQLREREGLQIDADFVGLREMSLVEAEFDTSSREAELTVRFVGELTSVVRDKDGNVTEGDANEIKAQRDTWSFARTMGSDNPNWKLVATGD